MIGDPLMNFKTLKEKNKLKTSMCIIALYLVIVWIASHFIITGDDYYFINKTFSSFNDVKTIEPLNGRYLGNALEVLIVNLSISQLNIIKTIFMGTGIFLMILLVSKSTELRIRFNFLYVATLLLIAPSGIYREVYSWTPGYINYLIPILGLLICLQICRNIFIGKSTKNNILNIIIISIVGFLSQFFMEHMTIYSVMLSLFILILYYIKYKKITFVGLAYFISSALGAIIMFSCPGYRGLLSSTETYRSTGFSSIKTLIIKLGSNIIEASRDIVIKNYILTIVLVILCMFILKYSKSKNNKKIIIINKFIGSATIIYVIINYCLIENIIKLYTNPFVYFINVLIAFAFLFLLLSTVILFINNTKYKFKIIFYIVSVLLASAPLLVVSPIGSRCFYISYVFLTIVALDLLSYLLEELNVNIPYLEISTIILLSITCICAGYIYKSTKDIFDLRKAYISNQMKNDKTEIKIPSFLYQKYIQNDTNDFLGVYYYYNERNDIQFNFIDINEWNNLLKNGSDGEI